jgi:hypothetical protein
MIFLDTHIAIWLCTGKFQFLLECGKDRRGCG